MTCPRCGHEIVAEFYCMVCGFVPNWTRNGFEIAKFESWRRDFRAEGVGKKAA